MKKLVTVMCSCVIYVYVTTLCCFILLSWPGWIWCIQTCIHPSTIDFFSQGKIVISKLLFFCAGSFLMALTFTRNKQGGDDDDGGSIVQCNSIVLECVGRREWEIKESFCIHSACYLAYMKQVAFVLISICILYMKYLHFVFYSHVHIICDVSFVHCINHAR